MRDNTLPTGQWAFDDEVTACFADMLERSIPDYRQMRALCAKIGARYIKPGTLVVDAGCSTGIAAEPFVRRYSNENQFLLIDNSAPMVAASKERYRGMDAVTVAEGNLWEFLPFSEKTSLVTCVLTLQFTPTAYRQQMLQNICLKMVRGGALLLVEKIVGCDNDELLVDIYYDMKRENGYTGEQIKAKRKSLENVLSPLTASWNEDMLRNAGFRQVEMFWRCLNFCGWVAVK